MTFLRILFLTCFLCVSANVLSFPEDDARDLRIPSTMKYIWTVNSKLSYEQVSSFAKNAVTSSDAFNHDLRVFLALVTKESSWFSEAVNGESLGLTQVIPKYHGRKIRIARSRLGVHNIYDPRLNLYVGAWILREYLDATSNMHDALLRYNGGGRKYPRRILAEASRIKL